MYHFPVPSADLFNAGFSMHDRGRYKNSGAFTWMPSGNNGFTGVLLGYAPYTSGLLNQVDGVNGSVGIDGSAAIPVYGWGAIEIDRYVSGSVQVNGGIAWGVRQDNMGYLPSNFEIRRAMDRVHKDGSWAAIDYQVQHGSPGGNLTYTADLVNQAGSGVLKDLTCMIDYVPPGTTTNASMALDVYIDGIYRFSTGITRRTLNGDGQTPGMTASLGFIKYNSSLLVQIRRAHDGTQLQVYASCLHYLGA